MSHTPIIIHSKKDRLGRVISTLSGLLLFGLLLPYPGAAATDLPSSPRLTKDWAAEPQVTEQDLVQIREIMVKLCKAFLNGDVNAAMDLFGGVTSQGSGRLEAIRVALTREFELEQYSAFEVLDEIEADDSWRGSHHSVWVCLRYMLKDRKQDMLRENYQNEIFVFRKDRNGSFQLDDSPFFDTIGRRKRLLSIATQGFDIPHLLAGFMALLAFLGFWVWMGFEAFKKRPRNYFWRISVLIVPLIGAVVFFFGSYLPDLRRGRLSSE